MLNHHVMQQRTGSSWLGAHIFLDRSVRPCDFDAVLRDLVDPVVDACMARGLASGHFFIRYWEHGPHIRLRFRGLPVVLRDDVRPVIEAAVVAHLPRFAHGVPDPALVDAEPSTHPCLWWVPYIPETARYGGAELLPLSERIFQASSALSQRLLRALPAHGDSERFGRALASMVMLLALSEIDQTTAAEIARVHRDHWAGAASRSRASRDWHLLRYARIARADPWHGALVRNIWSVVRNGDDDGLPPEFIDFVCEIRSLMGQLRDVSRERTTARSWEQVCIFLLPSYLHMSNNRLGVRATDEGLLGHIIYDALAASSEEGQGVAETRAGSAR